MEVAPEYGLPLGDTGYECLGVLGPGRDILGRGLGKNPLRLHPITFSEDGRILVDTDQAIEREAFDPAQLSVPPAVAAAAPA